MCQQYNKIVAAGYKKSGHQNGIRFRGHSHRAQKKGGHLDSLLQDNLFGAR